MNIIVAVDRKLGIGKNNKLLAYIKPDLEYFKNTTKDQVVVMGYNTYMSLPKRPLPNRVNVVITSKDIELEGAVVIHSIEEVVNNVGRMYPDKEVFICGGASIYEQMMPYVDKLYVTHILDTFEADTFFPSIGEEWSIESATAEEINLSHQHPHMFVVYEKKE